MIPYKSSIVTMSLSYRVSKILSVIFHNLQRSRDIERLGQSVTYAPVLINVNLYFHFVKRAAVGKVNHAFPKQEVH